MECPWGFPWREGIFSVNSHVRVRYGLEFDHAKGDPFTAQTHVKHSNFWSSFLIFFSFFFVSCTELAGKYDEGNLSFKTAWSYIVIINNCSQVVCTCRQTLIVCSTFIQGV